MVTVLHFILGFITSFLGSIFPSMLSMTVVKISIQESQKKAFNFALGVSSIVIFQAYIAVGFSKILLENPFYLQTIQQIGTIIFAGLSIFFFWQASKAKKQQEFKNSSKSKGFLLGVLFSTLNMFAIPFYFGVTSSLVMMNWYNFNPTNNLLFVLGSAVGTFLLLFLYAFLAKKIEYKAQMLAEKLDLFLGIITGLVFVINLADILL